MITKVRPRTEEPIYAFMFDGTEESAIRARDWVSEHDVENCEVTYQSGALDVINAFGLKTLEAGDYIYILEGTLYAEKQDAFHKIWEIIR